MDWSIFISGLSIGIVIGYWVMGVLVPPREVVCN